MSPCLRTFHTAIMSVARYCKALYLNIFIIIIFPIKKKKPENTALHYIILNDNMYVAYRSGKDVT